MDQHPKPETVLGRGINLDLFYNPTRGKRMVNCHNLKRFKTVNYTNLKIKRGGFT